MIFPTKENPGTREAHIASYEADWKDVLPKSEIQKNKLMTDIVDGIRERWKDEFEYANKTQTFPLKVYLPNRKVCKISESVEYIRDPRDYKKIYPATKGVFYNELGFESIPESGLFSTTNYWMTKTQAQYIVNILPAIKDLDARAHPISTTSHGGYVAASHGGCSSGTCACTGGGCSPSCCGH